MTVMDAVFTMIVGTMIGLVLGALIYLIVSDFLGRD